MAGFAPSHGAGCTAGKTGNPCGIVLCYNVMTLRKMNRLELIKTEVKHASVMPLCSTRLRGEANPVMLDEDKNWLHYHCGYGAG